MPGTRPGMTKFFLGRHHQPRRGLNPLTRTTTTSPLFQIIPNAKLFVIGMNQIAPDRTNLKKRLLSK
jgi:hypothetical protein